MFKLRPPDAFLLMLVGCGAASPELRTSSAVPDDRDGIERASDFCPDDPEDIDGFDDADGCPDADNDHDGILDACDGCPNDPETINGWEDLGGCPDPGVTIVVPDPNESVSLAPMPYADGGASVAPEMLPRLEAIARALADGPAVVEVTATAPPDPHAIELAQARVERAADALARFGVVRERLRTYALVQDSTFGELRIIPLYTEHDPPRCPPPPGPE